MRYLVIKLVLVATLVVAGCDFWPRELQPLAESIDQKVSGQSTVWLVGGDVVLIDVARSPLYRENIAGLEDAARGIANQAIAFTPGELESVVVTFHEAGISDDPEKMRQFVFLVEENRLVETPALDFNASGPLTADEVQALFLESMDESLAAEQKACVLAEAEKLARQAGDPASLDPSSLDYRLPEAWSELDDFGKRLILAQVITTQALFSCP